jgi:outer membrane beta-barrel protein
MVKRFTTGILTAYHFSENIAAEGAFIFSPDLGESDLKPLTNTLVQIAYEGSANLQFQQPLDKMLLGATFAARWAPVYGKINIIGENVVNFDMYGVLGLGMLSTNLYYAQYDESAPADAVPVKLIAAGRKLRVPLNVGFGINFFLNQSIALKIDARNYMYRALKPQYDPEIQETEYRLYSTLVASAGVSVFIPKMRPRLMDF